MSISVPNLKSATLLRLGMLAATVTAYAGLLVAAAADAAVVYLVLVVVAVLLDLYLDSRESWLRTLLRTAQFSLSVRGVLLSLSLALLMVRHFDSWGDGHIVAVVLVAISLPLSRSVYLGVLAIFRTRTTRPLATRNIDLGKYADPEPPPLWLTAKIVERRLVLFGAIPVAVGAVGVLADTAVPFVAVALAYVLILAAATGYLGAQLIRSVRLPSHEVWEAQTLRRIRDLHAQVVLYFSGPADSYYQINMWLEPLEKLPYRIVVLLRERNAFDGLAPTTLPVACIPDGISVMQAGLFSARVALYPANTSKNLHMLREPGIKHVFIGHGDSDKVSSINPFTRVYDQVWVAGRAGRDRWSRANVGVRDEAIVEVGRPQLDVVHPVEATGPKDRVTVLYAPTWEGWNDNTFFTSITRMGPILIRALLDMGPTVRVIYKPHPFTGTRDPKALRAHAAIVRMLSEAISGPAVLPDDAQLAALTTELDRSDLSVAQNRQLSADWASRYWSVVGDSHVVVDGERPTLYDCFDHADVLIADVSSVVTDFLASGKPYVCANLQGLDHDEFRRENPTAGAAYLLGPDCSELTEIIEQVRGPDPKESDRATLRQYLLGPDDVPSLTRWKAALDALMRDADADRANRAIGIDESIREEVEDDGERASSEAPTL